MARSVAPAIVIAAYDRPEHLRRLHASVAAADIAPDTTLIVSIDGGGANNAQVSSVASHLTWNHGPLRIVEHDHLGLVDHFLFCGDLTEEFGSVVLLEDDLLVGPAFHQWAIAALDHTCDDDRVAGVSLAAPFFDGYRHLPFEPVLDGSDAVFAQIPWYDGMAWTSAMWTRFRSTAVDPLTPVHRSLDQLDADEWFPNTIRYLVQTGRYYLFPRHAHATNSGAAGAHFAEATNYFQVPLTLQGPTSWRLHDLDDALAVYDDHLELTPGALIRLVPGLAAFDFATDLRGVRDLDAITATHVLTTRQVRNATRLWGASMHPLAANLVHNVAGDAIRLATRADVIVSDESDRTSLNTLTVHANRGRGPTGRDALRQLAAGVKGRLQRGR